MKRYTNSMYTVFKKVCDEIRIDTDTNTDTNASDQVFDTFYRIVSHAVDTLYRMRRDVFLDTDKTVSELCSIESQLIHDVYDTAIQELFDETGMYIVYSPTLQEFVEIHSTPD